MVRDMPQDILKTRLIGGFGLGRDIRLARVEANCLMMDRNFKLAANTAITLSRKLGEVIYLLPRDVFGIQNYIPCRASQLRFDNPSNPKHLQFWPGGDIRKYVP